ncbi:MAG: HEPN domain-containing protein, partial [Methanosarcinales archaeon]
DQENLINIQIIESAVHDLALNRIEVAEDYYSIAKHLLDNDLHYRSIISRAYYGMYHAARAVVYLKMRLDVPVHKKLIKKFKKVLINEYNDYTFSTLTDDW